MKKAKFMALALAGAITLMGAGYASWTDSLTITNTVKTGELSTNFVTTGTGAPTVTQLNDNGASAYVNVQPVTAAAKTLDMVVTNLYPGAGFQFSARFNNDGTIPAVITPTISTAQVGTEPKLADNQLKFDGTVTYHKQDGTTVVFDKSGNNAVTLDSFETQLATWLTNKRLEPLSGTNPAEYITFDNVKVTLISGAANDTTENASLKLTILMDMAQHN